MAKTSRAPKRPMPPAQLGKVQDDHSVTLFVPGDEVADWIAAEILAEDGAIHNPDHAHLIDADIAVLWAAGGFDSKMRTVIGTAEEVAFRCNVWQRERQEQQLAQWFGRVPHFLITLDGAYCRTCTDADFCALVEHELYHIAQKKDFGGAPRFGRDGQPLLAIQGHDVEEFVGVVRRYGVGSPGGSLAQLVAAASKKPEVSGYKLATACGTCLLRAA
jgi:hypothetical protein